MARRRSRGPKNHAFRNKLLLNQWLISLFGIDPLREHTLRGKTLRPFHVLADPIKDPRMEGLDHDNLHRFYYNLVESELFWDDTSLVSKEQLLAYEQHIVRHTLKINEKRSRPIVWKYYQWLTLLFIEIYLDRYFNDREGLLSDLNAFVDRFNRHWVDYKNVPPYTLDDLNKFCLQSATGSGKTLLMHVNLLQYRHYAKQTGQDKELSRIILLTPNERLSEQHLSEFRESGISAGLYLQTRGGLFGAAGGLDRVDVLEITKLADQEGPNTIATRSFGDQNLVLVDEGHRGMSGKDEGAWLARRASLCEKGFTFEYSATFEQAVASANRLEFEDSYAKSIIFDYSYRWFYEDGFGKDYQILNMPDSFDAVRAVYLTACLLKFYQQLLIYDEKHSDFQPFNLEKPLWVFVGSTVTKARGTNDEKAVAADVAQIIQFVADFLGDPSAAEHRIETVLTGSGRDTGLLDKNNSDIFEGSFTYLVNTMNEGKSVENIYRNILRLIFNNPAGGKLELCRLRGDSGEIILKAGTAEEPFGLINVGDALGLCNHCQDVCKRLSITETDFADTMFASIKHSSSPVNLLVGSKKFVEGWDCWRVSTMGLMHVGKSEGTQIIQLFGRGVRLKGYEWCLKRSGHSFAPKRPLFIEELETLNVFGIEADFMEKFREFLKEEGLPGNERRQVFTIPLNVTHEFGKRLRILRPKRKTSDGHEYDFKKDAPVPEIGVIPKYLTDNPVVTDWYSRIHSIRSRGTVETGRKDRVNLREQHLALLDYDELYFDLERFKRERTWYNLNISKDGIRRLLQDSTWYTLSIPDVRMVPTSFNDTRIIQQVAGEMLKRYCDHYYNYCKREYLEPRLELRDLTTEDDNIPDNDEYQLIVDGDETTLINSIEQIKKDLEENKKDLLQYGDLCACNFNRHLYQPLFHVKSTGKITILPVALGESEYQFVVDLKEWCEKNGKQLKSEGQEIFLLRNLSKGKGVGFFEAGNFHPDFIMWLLRDKKQYVSFIEPHGLIHEGPASEKMLFHEKIKNVEQRLGDPDVILNSFILSWTQYPQLKWGPTREDLENKHILFMNEDRDHYIEKLFTLIK